MASTASFMVPYTIVEWNRVRSLFRSKNLEDLKEVRNILGMWICRMGDNTPIAISCSDLLIQVAVMEKELENRTSGPEFETLKMMHCTAVIRFINYTNEISQPEGGGRTSVVISCSKLGIPAWLVEIRHNASHSHLPPLRTLRKAFYFCFEWIWDNFWSQPADVAVLHAGNQAMQQTDEYEDTICNALVEFIRWRAAKPNVDSGYLNVKVIQNLHNLLIGNSQQFLQLLVAEGYMIMAPSQLEMANLSAPPGWIVPVILQLFWKPVFEMITEANLTAELLIALLNHDNCPGPIANQVVAWVSLILGTALRATESPFSPTEWSRILQRLIAWPSSFPSELVDKVIERVPNMTQQRRRQVLHILEATMSESMLKSEEPLGIQTVDQLQWLIKKDRRKHKKDAGIIEEDPDDWAGIPLGLCPNQNYEDFSLIITDEWLAEQDAKHQQRLQPVDEIILE